MKVIGQLKYCIISIEIAFGLSSVSGHCSELPKLLKIRLYGVR
jgi:hypothetical protein